MAKTRIIKLHVFPLLIMAASWLPIGQLSAAQTARVNEAAVAQEQSKPPQQEEKTAGENKTFTGKIVKSGDMLVLAAPTEKKTYQLDDQEKAHEFLNKQVKVTGILDSASGIIRVSAIEPA